MPAGKIDPGRGWSRLRRVCELIKRLIHLELGIYASIWRAISRRPAIPPGATGFAYHRPVLTVLVIFIVLSAIEIPILDLIVHRWLLVRVFVFILGLWGLTWMVGLLCAMLMRPHAVGPEGIWLRNGIEIDIALLWSDIAQVEIAASVVDGKASRVSEERGIVELSLRIANETNILITLERPVEVKLPGNLPGGGTHRVDRVRIWVDEPKEFLSSVAHHIHA